MKWIVLTIGLIHEILCFSLRKSNPTTMNNNEHFNCGIYEFCMNFGNDSVKSRITFDVYILNQNDKFTHDLLFFNSTDCLSTVETSSYHAFIATTEHSPGVFNYTIQNATITTTPSFSFCKELQSVTDYSFSDFVKLCPVIDSLEFPFPLDHGSGIVYYESYENAYLFNWTRPIMYTLVDDSHCTDSIVIYAILVPFLILLFLTVTGYMFYNLFYDCCENWNKKHKKTVVLKPLPPRRFSNPIPLNHNPYSFHSPATE